MERNNTHARGPAPRPPGAALWAAVAVGCATAAAHADIVGKWTFDNRSVVANAGEGSAKLVGTQSAGWCTGTTGRRTDRSIGVRGFDGSGDQFYAGYRGIAFDLCTCDWDDLRVSWSQRIDRNASRWMQFQYSVDGDHFKTDGLRNDGMIRVGRANAFLRFSMDLRGIEGVADNEHFAFRIVAVKDPSTRRYATVGGAAYRPTARWMIDSVTAVGSPFAGGGGSTPAPGALGVAAVAGLLGRGRRRRTDR